MSVEQAIKAYKKEYDRPVIGYWVDGKNIILNVKPRIPDEPAQWIVEPDGKVYNTNPLRNEVIVNTPMQKL